MSYIKSAVVLDGIGRIVEVHGATWCYLDVQAYGRGGAKYYRSLADQARSQGNDPSSYERIAEDFHKVARNPRSINSGLARDILDRGLSPVSDDNRREWVRFALEEDAPGNAGNSEGPPAVLVDFALNKLIDTKDNSYAEYQHHLPVGWSYKRCEPEQMIEFLYPRLQKSDRPRLGSIDT